MLIAQRFANNSGNAGGAPLSSTPPTSIVQTSPQEVMTASGSTSSNTDSVEEDGPAKKRFKAA